MEVVKIVATSLAALSTGIAGGYGIKWLLDKNAADACPVNLCVPPSHEYSQNSLKSGLISHETQSEQISPREYLRDLNKRIHSQYRWEAIQRLKLPTGFFNDNFMFPEISTEYQINMETMQQILCREYAEITDNYFPPNKLQILAQCVKALNENRNSSLYAVLANIQTETNNPYGYYTIIPSVIVCFVGQRGVVCNAKIDLDDDTQYDDEVFKFDDTFSEPSFNTTNSSIPTEAQNEQQYPYLQSENPYNFYEGANYKIIYNGKDDISPGMFRNEMSCISTGQITEMDIHLNRISSHLNSEEMKKFMLYGLSENQNDNDNV